MMQIDNPYLRRLAEIESGMNPRAANPRSSARGLFQFMPATAQQYGLQDPLDPAQAIPAAERFTEDNRNYLRKALGREPTAGELYLAHQQGAAGATKLLTNPNAMAADVLGQDAVTLNAGDPSMTAQQFSNQWINKFNSGYQEEEPLTPEEEAELAALEAEAPLTPEEEAELAALEAPPEDKGFIDKVSQSAHDRAQKYGKILNSDEPAIGKGYLALGQSAGLANDVVGHALSALTPDFIGEPLSQAGEYVLNLAGSLPSMGGGTIGEKIPKELALLETEFPRASEYARATTNLGLLAASTKIGGSAPVSSAVAKSGKAAGTLTKPVARAAGNATKNIKTGIQSRGADALDDAAQAIKARSSDAYARMRETGAVFKPEAAEKIIKKIETDFLADGKLNPRLHDKVLGLMDDFKAEAAAGDVSLESLDQWRQLFGEVAGNFTDKVNARKASKIMNSLDEAIGAINEKDIASGSKEAIDALKFGRQEWARQSKFNRISEIVKKSEGDANYLKRELKKLADNPKKIRGFTAKELEALREASKLSTGEGILKMLGKFGLDFGGSRLGSGVGAVVGSVAGGAATGGLGAVAAPVIGTAARQGQKYIARGKAENLLKIIEGGGGTLDDALNASRLDTGYGQSALGKLMLMNKDKPLKSIKKIEDLNK